jgi:DNA-binding CsgD family transcriptional regulator
MREHRAERATGGSRVSWRAHALFAGLATSGLTGLWAVTRDRTPIAGDEGAGYWWPLWITLLWGLVVLAHYLQATGRIGPRRWRSHAMLAASASAGIIGLWAVTRDRTPIAGDEGAGYWWPLWVAFIWGMIVLAHYLYATGRWITPAQPHPGPSAAQSQPVGYGEPAAIGPVPGPPVPSRTLEILTGREREVLALLAEGHPNQEIADRLFISERTARTHVSNILRKLELPSRTHAALVAVRAGIATAPGHEPD